MMRNCDNRRLNADVECGYRIKGMAYPTYANKTVHLGGGMRETPLIECPVCHKLERVTHLEFLPEEEPIQQHQPRSAYLKTPEDFAAIRSAARIEEDARRDEDNVPYYLSLAANMFKKSPVGGSE